MPLLTRLRRTVSCSTTLKAAIDIAIRCRERDEPKTILFNLSGHGLLDLKAYEDKLANTLVDYEPDTEKLKVAMAAVPAVP